MYQIMVTLIHLIDTSTHLVWIETHLSVFTIYETHMDGDDGDRDRDVRGWRVVLRCNC